jgi:hypothetical protein
MYMVDGGLVDGGGLWLFRAGRTPNPKQNKNKIGAFFIF